MTFVNGKIAKVSVLLLLAIVGSACTNYRYIDLSGREPPNPLVANKHEKDRGPARPMDVSHIKDAVPRREPLAKSGNKTPYQVLGKTYHVDFNTKGFRQRGKASWYGKKFHGKLTSSGELYNMYGMTAAHKSLPLPTYVRVKNVNNGKQVVVRVNDRGPFHGGRIIDLTYSAAKKLGFEDVGTAEVEVSVIPEHEFVDSAVQLGGRVSQGNSASSAPAPRNSAGYELPPNTFLQVGAFGKVGRAGEVKRLLGSITERPILVEPVKGKPLYKVLIGPFDNGFEMAMVQERVAERGFGSPAIIYR